MAIKNNNTFCTIITKDYLAWALTLYDSISLFNKSIKLQVLIVDIFEVKELKNSVPRNLELNGLKDIIDIKKSKDLQIKYKNNLDSLRWSLKPIYIEYLLLNFEKVIYSDCDIYFFNNYQFLFDELDKNNVLLTPHWRSKDPEIDRANFDLLFKGGLYNAGFFAANNKAQKVLEFWAKNCYEVCELDLSNGQYVDQTHLNLFPIYFNDIKILKHKGCNIANWNQIECKRTINTDTGMVEINNEFPIVFIHFTKSTIIGILTNFDEHLKTFLNLFNKNLVKNGYQDLIQKYLIEIENSKESKKKESDNNMVNRLLEKFIKKY